MAGNDLLSPLISAAFGLIGVGLGGFLAFLGQRRDRKERYILEQLTGFYAPMLGIWERLRAKHAVRLKVSTAATTEWPRLMNAAQASGTLPETLAEKSPEFDRMREYGNQQLEVDIALYEQMLDLFTTKMHLAQPGQGITYPHSLSLSKCGTAICAERYPVKSLNKQEQMKMP
jgi:hypothetical protein